MENPDERPEPYRILFLTGLLMGVLGVLPWIFLRLGAGSLLPANPVAFHGRTMFWGFLGAFVSGFLMTAAPKMSASWPSRPWETLVAIVLLVLQTVFSFAGLEALSLTSLSLVIFFLFAFLGRRFVGRRQNPPSMFVFVPVGLLSALVGCALLLFRSEPSAELALYSKRLLYDAFVLNLIAGLGSRLIPVLSRVPGVLSPSVAGGGAAGWKKHLPILVALNTSFAVEAFLSREAGFALRALTLAVVAVRDFKVLRPRVPPGALGTGLRIGVFSLVLPYFLIPLFPGWELHLLHLSYVGGFALMTLMIATRVVLAHGGQPLEFELRTRALVGIAGLIVSAALVRALWPLLEPERLFTAAAAAAAVWLAGLCLWWLSVGRKIERILRTIRG